jgi:hypothetical protein
MAQPSFSWRRVRRKEECGHFDPESAVFRNVAPAHCVTSHSRPLVLSSGPKMQSRRRAFRPNLAVLAWWMALVGASACGRSTEHSVRAGLDGGRPGAPAAALDGPSRDASSQAASIGDFHLWRGQVARTGPCTFEVGLPLEPLPPGAQGVALISQPAPVSESEDPLLRPENSLIPMRCNAGQVLRELPRALFDPHNIRAVRPDAVLHLELDLGFPMPKCEPVLVRPCLRMASGSLDEAHEEHAQHSGQLDQHLTLDGPTTETPSGAIAVGSVERGFVVSAYDPSTGGLVAAKVLRTVDRQSGGRHGSGFVELTVANRLPLYLPADRQVYLAQDRTYRPAKSLAAGDVLLGPDAQPFALSAAPHVAEDADGRASFLSLRIGPVDRGLDVAYPDNYFLNGVLVRDVRRSPRQPSDEALPVEAAVAADVDLRPATASYDCGLEAELTVRSLPGDAEGVAIFVVSHPGAPGTRQTVDCSTNEPYLVLSRHVLDLSRAAGGGPPRLKLTIAEEGRIECDGSYSMFACVQGAGGAYLAPTRRLARFGRAGPVCLARGTPIQTPSGPVAIETLGRGDPIIAYDEAAGRAIVTPVRAVIPRGEQEVRRLELDDGTALLATRAHLFYLPQEDSYRRLDRLQPGDRLLGSGARLRQIRSLVDAGTAQVFDLSVSPPHNYFASGVLSHNY